MYSGAPAGVTNMYPVHEAPHERLSRTKRVSWLDPIPNETTLLGWLLGAVVELILGAALSIGILAYLDVNLPFFPSTEHASSTCSLEAQRAFANSPLTGWPREDAIGQFAATCMETKGFVWRERADLCYRVAPHGEQGGYASILARCWSRW